MSAYIYAVDAWSGKVQMHRAVIIRETTKRITTGITSLAFHCRRIHDPERVYRTLEDARKAFVAQQEQSATSAQQQVTRHLKLANLARTMSLVSIERT